MIVRPKTIDKAAARKAAAAIAPPQTREEFFAEVVAGAVEYRASRFLGRGRYDTRTGATLAEAARHSLDMGVDRVMIYAVDRRGRSVLINAGGKPVSA